jgi:hypothetical protein
MIIITMIKNKDCSGMIYKNVALEEEENAIDKTYFLKKIMKSITVY